MATLALISLGLLLLVALEQGVAVLVFMRYCRQTSVSATDRDLPKVLVVLPVRGADDTLADCIAALARQNYPNYRVRVVLDSDVDPGRQIIDGALANLPDLPIEVVELIEPHSRCSLKCSAVYQVTEDLGDCEVVALLDTDVVPHSNWLRELIAPLADEQVGATTGNRWYLPQQGQWGSLVRYSWNAAAVATMYFWGMPWGGTLAIKRTVLDGTDLRERWLRAGCEDVPLVAVLKKLGLRIHFVPSLLMVDRNECQMGSCLPFLDRQLLWTRLYYPACWWACNVWQIVIALSMVISLFSALAGLATGQWLLLVYGTLAIGTCVTTSLVMVRWMERCLLPKEKGPAVHWPLKAWCAIALTNLLMVRVVWISLLTREINWRGIDYKISGPWDVQLVEYRPYSAAPTAAESKQSEALV